MLRPTIVRLVILGCLLYAWHVHRQFMIDYKHQQAQMLFRIIRLEQK